MAYHMKLKKRKAWENISALLESLQGSWIYFGDFNIVPRDDEMAGGRKGSILTPNYLRDILFELGAMDLGFIGNGFTWSR